MAFITSAMMSGVFARLDFLVSSSWVSFRKGTFSSWHPEPPRYIQGTSIHEKKGEGVTGSEVSVWT